MLASNSTRYDGLALLLMLRSCAVVVSLLSVLLCASSEDAPITWPDPRHLRVSYDQQWANTLILDWPVKKYCAENVLVNFSATITRSGSRKSWRVNSKAMERLYATIDSDEAEYYIAAVMKTKFDLQGVSANATLKRGTSPRLSYRPSRSAKEVHEVPADGNGPFVVVLKHSNTGECLLIIYDKSSASHTMEEMDVCQGEKPALKTIVLPIKAQSLGRSTKKHLKFELPRDLLRSLPKFNITAHSVSKKAKFELDPPRDVYGKLKLTSPKEARLTVTFRPPASNPDLIHNFTFFFSHTNETIVFVVTKDNKPLPDRTKKTIVYEQVVRAQQYETVQFEVSPSAPFEYPGNYTVTASTNGAVNNTAVHSIIMPHFNALQPPFHELHVSWDSVTAKWGKPQQFQGSCTYLVEASPLEENATRVRQAPRPNDETVIFRNLTADAKYEINLQSNCTNNEPFWTRLGVVETNPGVPGIPADVQLTPIGPGTVKLTWTAPSELPGKHPYYKWNCGLNNKYPRMTGETTHTYTVLKGLAEGTLSCRVQAVMKTKMHMDKHGTESPAVVLVVKPAEPTSPETTQSPLSTNTPKEEKTETASTTTQQPVPPETTHATLSTAIKVEPVVSPLNELPEHGYTALPPEQTVEGRVNTKTALLAVFGTLGAFLVVTAAVLMLQRWRRRNAAKMFENTPPADLPPFSS